MQPRKFMGKSRRRKNNCDFLRCWWKCTVRKTFIRHFFVLPLRTVIRFVIFGIRNFIAAYSMVQCSTRYLDICMIHSIEGRNEIHFHLFNYKIKMNIHQFVSFWLLMESLKSHLFAVDLIESMLTMCFSLPFLVIHWNWMTQKIWWKWNVSVWNDRKNYLSNSFDSSTTNICMYVL